jgi:hypothetical protein
MAYVVGGTATLEASIEGTPDAVALTVRAPDGTVTTPTPDVTGSTATYELSTDQAGRWIWEYVFTVGGDTRAFQGGITVGSSVEFGSTALVASVADVETKLGRELTAAEAARVDELIVELIDVLEIKLNRYLWPREVVENHYLLPYGRLHLRHGPVQSITSILVDGVAETLPSALASWETYPWVDSTPIVVTYVAGDDPPSPAVRGVIVDAITRTVQAGVAAGSGAIKSYAVEGTSITYGNVADGGESGSGRLTVGDIRGVGRKRRPVLLT